MLTHSRGDLFQTFLLSPSFKGKEAEAKSLTRGGATRIEGRGEHPASLVDRQELANK